MTVHGTVFIHRYLARAIPKKNIAVLDPLCSSFVETNVLIWCVWELWFIQPHLMLPEHAWGKGTNILYWAWGRAAWLCFTPWLHYYQTSWHKDRGSAHDLRSWHIAWCGKATPLKTLSRAMHKISTTEWRMGRFFSVQYRNTVYLQPSCFKYSACVISIPWERIIL